MKTNLLLQGRKEDARRLIERCASVNGAELPPQLLESMEATVAREIAEERALDKVGEYKMESNTG